jgi:hypothetical protein
MRPHHLARHDCLPRSRGVHTQWRFFHADGRVVGVGVTSRLRCGNGKIAQDRGLAGCI